MVIFIISCFKNNNTGKGGHFYSLLHVARELSEDYKIFVVGDFFPPVYKDQQKIVSFISSGRRKKILQAVHDIGVNKISIVHAFDKTAAGYGDYLSSRIKKPFVVTKAGGKPMPKSVLPFENMVVFQKEDLDNINSRLLSKPKKIALIPNRVPAPTYYGYNRKNPFASSSSQVLKILRIARYSNIYLESIIQAIGLHKKLLDEQLPSELVVIGAIQDESVFEYLVKNYKMQNVSFISSSDYTENAADFIVHSDIVVGTGRGFIEGMAHGKMVFFPVRGKSIPCFTNNENYEEAFYKNFSPRIVENNAINVDKAYSDFLKVLSCKRSEYSEFIKKKYLNDHSARVGAVRLEAFWKEVTNKNSLFKYYKRKIISVLVRIGYRVFRWTP